MGFSVRAAVVLVDGLRGLRLVRRFKLKVVGSLDTISGHVDA
jgi:hypothetical protein